MSAHGHVLDGTATATAIKQELRARVRRLVDLGLEPALGTLLVGGDEASRAYVELKRDDCAEVGLGTVSIELADTADQTEIEDAVDRLNRDPEVTALLVQLPLPAGIDEQRVIERVDPAKDADGLHPLNLGRLVLRADPSANAGDALPCTPAGVLELLERHHIELAGRLVVIVGDGSTVARPLALMFARRRLNATVVLVPPDAAALADETRRADVVISAVGRPGLLRPEWVKPGAAVVDVGMTSQGSSASGAQHIVGDVAVGVSDVAEWISPTPGGMGPMTRVMLLANVVAAAERAADLLPALPGVRRIGDDLADDAAAGERRT